MAGSIKLQILPIKHKDVIVVNSSILLFRPLNCWGENVDPLIFCHIEFHSSSVSAINFDLS